MQCALCPSVTQTDLNLCLVQAATRGAHSGTHHSNRETRMVTSATDTMATSSVVVRRSFS